MPSSRRTRGRQPRPRKTLIYAVAGVGKSTWATSAPQSVAIPTEDGLGDIDCVKYPVARSVAEFADNCREVWQDRADFRNVVVDSGDWLHQLCVEAIRAEKNLTSIEDIGYGKGWKFADDLFFKSINFLDALHGAGLGIIVICHAKAVRFADPARDSYDRWEPKLRAEPRERLIEWADEVFFATYKTFTTEKDVGFNRKETKAIGTGERVIYTTARPSHVAKNRLGMPDEIPMTWDAYAAYFPGVAAAPVAAG